MRILLWGCAGMLLAVGMASAADIGPAPPVQSPASVAPSAATEPHPEAILATDIEAVTNPSADVTLSFVRPGRVAEILVKEGDAVKPADVLVRLDDAAERIQLVQLKAQADDVIRIQAAEAQAAQKKEDVKKLEMAGKEGAATQWEIEHARLEVTIGDLSVALARFNQEQDRGKYEEAKAQLDRMQIASPIVGKVEKIFVEPGESAEALAKIIRVVKTDVFWIDVPVSLAVARNFSAGQTVQVLFPAAERPTDGKINHIAAVADAASETLTVRVEVPNPAARPAGERVRVRFPAAPAVPATPAGAEAVSAPQP